jgi:hypothetical protein
MEGGIMGAMKISDLLESLAGLNPDKSVTAGQMTLPDGSIMLNVVIPVGLRDAESYTTGVVDMAAP